MNGNKVKAGFEKQLLNLKLDQILPLKTIKSNFKCSQKYKIILSSVEEVGIIEPLVVCPQNGKRGDGATYHLLDGHLRYEVLKQLERKETICLISTDDEAYTYNRHVNRLSTIQEHMMIMKALKEGVDEQRLAKALSLDLSALREKQSVIKGICEEAVDLLKETGNDVTLIDVDLEKIKKLQKGIVPFYEPGLQDLLHRNLRQERLTFSTDLKSAIARAQVAFISVGTPESKDGSADLRYVLEVAAAIGSAMIGQLIVVNKSTVPVGTAQKVAEVIQSRTQHRVSVVSNS